MRVERLQLEQLRLFERLELEFAPGANVLVGGNGAGKTSVLEAIHLLAYGRSFRGQVRDGLIRRGQTALNVFAEVRHEDGAAHRLGLRRSLRDWDARVDGVAAEGLSELYRHLAVVCFEPGSHDLIGGGSEFRRRFVDWALFHVEPEFLPQWRRYQRALKQRNVLLKAGAADSASLDAWERELAETGEALTRQREAYLARLVPQLRELATTFLAELGEPGLKFAPGWSRDHPSLEAALAASRPRDLALGHTTCGPHRSDWSLGFERAPSHSMLSRGQEKLAALACVLAQAQTFVADRQTWPVLLLDDLGSELDAAHLALALRWLTDSPAQWILTGTTAPPGLPAARSMFHVEQGNVQRLL
jgi:DNA replication and repair protein RecF